MTVAENFNEKILDIWRTHIKEPALMPAHYPADHFKQNLKLLMLGMNPAYSEETIQRRLMGLKIDLTAQEVFGWSPETRPGYIDQLLHAENDAFVNYRRFFDPLRQFAKEVGCADSFSHLDLFHWRQTAQNDFLQVVGLPAALNAFGRAQVDLTHDTIMAIRPRVVVIANATAARRAVEFLPLTFIANSGTQCTLADLPDTRFFLAGMLSGGRAMDTFSRIRLEVEVRSYLDSIASREGAA